MKLSIILVNYKSKQLLQNCLDSIYQFDASRFEIIVVDNFSNDDVETFLKSKYPSVLFIQMGYNSGFARANNAGIRMASGDAVLLLNTDTINLNDAINISFDKFLNSNAAACGVQLLNEDLSPQITGNFAMKGGLNYLLPLPYWGSFLRFFAQLMKVKKPNVESASGTVEVDWINGAYLMVKMNVIQKSGLLDEDFFLYAEEAEWCSRIKKNGPLLIYGDCNVLHLQGQTANEAFASTGKGYFNLFDRKGLQIMLSNFVRIKKEFGSFWFYFDLLHYLITIPIFLFCLILESMMKGKKGRYTFQQWKGYCKNMFELVKYIPTIHRGKPHFYKVL